MAVHDGERPGSCPATRSSRNKPVLIRLLDCAFSHRLGGDLLEGSQTVELRFAQWQGFPGSTCAEHLAGFSFEHAKECLSVPGLAKRTIEF